MLQRDTDALTERQRTMVDEAEKSCQRLVAIVSELSDISKLDAGLISMARQPLDVFALVGDVAAHVQEARDREVLLEVRGQTDGARLSGDTARLRTAFDAIFRAILREKIGPATVIAERHIVRDGGRTSAVIVVADESSVQTAYDGTHAAFDEKRGGLGLALPLARRVIEGHGGHLSSASLGDDALSKGSAIISLPVTE
jgi:signal transduction histidine kinase